MRRAFVVAAAMWASGCCLVPKISTTHPTGYRLLVPIAPRCEKPKATDFAACSYSAEMLEAHDARKATAVFLSAWEKSAFGDFYQSVQMDRKRLDSVGLVGDSISLQKSINAFREICIPVLARIYQQSSDPYARKMEPQIDLIVVDSESSLAAFRAAHIDAQTAAGSPGPTPHETAAPAATATPAPSGTPATGVSSQIFHLRDGSSIRGELLSTDGGVMTIRTSVGTLKVDQSQIERIEFSPGAAATPASAATPSPTPSAAFAPTPVASATPEIASATPTPPVAFVTPSPVATPVVFVIEPPRTPFVKRLSPFASLGWHQYDGWSSASRYSAPTVQLGSTARLLDRGPLRFEGAVTAGYYSGSHCQADSATTCAKYSFTSLFLDAGPRVTWDAPMHLALYAEAGPGLHSSTFHWQIPAGDPAFASQTGGNGSSSVLHVGGYGLVGAGYELGSFRLFSELKEIKANATFPGKAGNNGYFSYDTPIGMGGRMILVGAEMSL
jgi:hypothetical protein